MIPNTVEGKIVACILIGYLCVLLDSVLWHLAGFGQWVLGMSESWVAKLSRKPPDPTLHVQRQRRRKLLKVLGILQSLPVIVAKGHSVTVANMARVIKSHDWSPENSAALRDLLRETVDQSMLASVNAKYAVADTGCSKCATGEKGDFIPSTYKPLSAGKTMGGIAGSLPIQGIGTIRFEMLDIKGRIKVIEQEAYHIEGLPCRLIPPQKVMASRAEGNYCINGEDGGRFVYQDGTVIHTPLDEASGLPMMTLFFDVNATALSLERNYYSCVTEENNQNLTPTQKETLRWHARLGHAAMNTIRWLGKRGLLGSDSNKLSKATDTPLCATCQYGKQTRRPTGTTRTEIRPEARGGIQHDKLLPGQEVAADQFEVIKRGRQFTTGGKEPEREKFCGGTIFIDVATGYTRVYMQVSLGASETIKSKHKFEQEALEAGVVVRAYRTDNGIFTKEQFLNELIENGQGITVSGVGAHHQNGVAERAIRTTVTKSRTMLLHAMLRWPEQTSSDFWPMAMQHASYLVNIVPTFDEGWSPEEKFFRVLQTTNKFKVLPVWGCPTYVLHPTLQDMKKLPKWNSRSRCGQYLGWSTLHASNVALVRNLDTGRISPQFHVVFDNWFETVHLDEKEENAPVWDVIVTRSRFEANLDPADVADYRLEDEWLTKEELLERRAMADRVRHRPAPPPARRSEGDVPNGTPTNDNHSEPSPTMPLPATPPANDPVPPSPSPVSSPAPDRGRSSVADTPTEAVPPRRSQRARQAPNRYGYDGDGVAGYLELVDYIRELAKDNRQTAEGMVAYWTMLSMNPLDDTMDSFQPVWTPMALKAAKKKGNPDIPTYGEAMAGPHREMFEEAMKKEVQQLSEKGTWQGVIRSSLPGGTKVVPLTWAFRIKRLPNGDFDKFKARICVRGDLQDEDGETYAPVVKWTTIRAVLAFAIKHDLKTRQIDFSNAFVQADLPENEQIFVELPKGFAQKGVDTVLKLKKSLYGLVRAPFLWFHTLKDSLVNLGYVPSKNDQCMFVNPEERIIVLVYTDDCLCFGWDDVGLDELVANLRKRGHELDEQSITKNVYAYLGIELNMSGSTVELLQVGLTEKILRTVGMENCSPNETPAKEKPLTADQDGDPFNEDWSYPSVVGMLMYLVNTRPDIQFAVHQAAKYTHHPRDCHASAVKKICRYLAGTKNRGLRFSAKPTSLSGLLQVDCYVDASFAPLWELEEPMNPDGSKSRSGHVIRVDDCPITWCSRKQGETALSTTEAEYMALSMAMRELLWVRRLVEEIAMGFDVKYDRRARIWSKVFEDNQGAIAVANRPDLTARTRHLHTKYHHFKEHLGIDSNGNGIEIRYIDTKQQIADIFTKGLGNEDFKRLRDMLMGWTNGRNDRGREGELEFGDADWQEVRGKASRRTRVTGNSSNQSGGNRNVTNNPTGAKRWESMKDKKE